MFNFFYFFIFCPSDPLLIAGRVRNGNGASSGRVAPIPTPPRLAKRIPIPVPFKKLNGAGRVWEFPVPAPPALFSFFFFLFKKITLKNFNYIKINIFYK